MNKNRRNLRVVKSSLFLRYEQKKDKRPLPRVIYNSNNHVIPGKENKHTRNLNKNLINFLPIKSQNKQLMFHYQFTDINIHKSRNNSTYSRNINLPITNREPSAREYKFDDYNITASNTKDIDRLFSQERKSKNENDQYIREVVNRLRKGNETIDKNFLKNLKIMPKIFNPQRFHNKLMYENMVNYFEKEKKEENNSKLLIHKKEEEEEEKIKKEEEQQRSVRIKYEKKELPILDYLKFRNKEVEFDNEYKGLNRNNKKFEKEIIQQELTKIRQKHGLLKPIDLHKIFKKPLFEKEYLKYKDLKKRNPILEINQKGTFFNIIDDPKLVNEFIEGNLSQCESLLKE